MFDFIGLKRLQIDAQYLKNLGKSLLCWPRLSLDFIPILAQKNYRG